MSDKARSQYFQLTLLSIGKFNFQLILGLNLKTGVKYSTLGLNFNQKVKSLIFGVKFNFFG